MRLVQRQKKKKKTKPLYQLIQAGRRVDVYCLGVGRKSWNITSSSVLAAASVALRFRWSTLGGQVVGLPSIVRGHSVPSAHRPSCCYRGAQHEEPPVLLPGRGHPRLRQRKQGAGDPHRSVSKSSFPNLSAFLLRHYYFIFLCVCLFVFNYIIFFRYLSPDRFSEFGSSKASSKFRIQADRSLWRSLRVRNGTRLLNDVDVKTCRNKDRGVSLRL